MPLNEIVNLSMEDKENFNRAAEQPKKEVKNELKSLEKDEPLLKENPRRFVILPIQVSPSVGPPEGRLVG